MPKTPEDLLTIHVNINITPSALSAIVENAKDIFGKDKNGRYRFDSADVTSEMISRFLLEKDFESYVKDKINYAHKRNFKKNVQVCRQKEDVNYLSNHQTFFVT